MTLKQKENTNKNYSTDKINTLYLAITDSLTVITTNLIMCNKLPVTGQLCPFLATHVMVYSSGKQSSDISYFSS